MWAIRVLNGPQTGEIFPLKEGKLRIGRSQEADIHLNSNGVSKEHLEIALVGSKIFLTDLNSSNGTFLNGTRIKGGTLKPGDKVGVHDIILEIVLLNERIISPHFFSYPSISAPQKNYYKQGPIFMHDSENPTLGAFSDPKTINEKLNHFVEEKIMPGFYTMTEQFDFKFVLGGLVLTYIIMVTLVAMLPMKEIAAEGISAEEYRRPLAVTRSLPRENEKNLHHEEDTHFSNGVYYSLFIQIFSLAFVFGGVLFFFLYKLVEYPFQQLLKELDTALRDRKGSMAIRIQMPALQKLIIIINSLLSRIVHPDLSQSTGSAGAGSKNQEYINILQLIGLPALLVAPNGLILKGNTAFPDVTGIALGFIENHYVSDMPDQVMQKNFMELMKAAVDMIPQSAKSNLEIKEIRYITTCQVATASTGEVDCYFITISPQESAEGQVA